jgi:hypothetical protein
MRRVREGGERKDAPLPQLREDRVRQLLQNKAAGAAEGVGLPRASLRHLRC